MSTVKEIYYNKSIIGQREDFDNLIRKINAIEPSIEFTDNCDRTMTLKYENEKIIEGFKDIFERALPSWLERDITCPIEYTYNLFPLNANQCRLRI